MIIRLVGIDFGASSTKISVRHYSELNNDFKDISEIQYVRFDNDSLKTPTLIREVEGKLLYGIDAESTFAEGTHLFNNLKEDLYNNNSENNAQTFFMIKMFFSFLYGKYKEQFSEIKCDNTITYLSIPIISDANQKNFMVMAALEAGFTNVEPIYEPLAAIKGILSEKAEIIGNNFYKSKNKAIDILVLDMGTGKTSASVCKYFYEIDRMEMINSCSDNTTGGKKLDSLLCDFLLEYLRDNGVELEFLADFKENYLTECIRFKENVLIKNLDKNNPTEECSFVSSILRYVGNANKPFPIITRQTFEQIFSQYLSQFPAFINKALNNDSLEGIINIDMVILTGGNSRWYFIKEMLIGKNTSFGSVNLPMIRNDSDCILNLENPEYTISHGLANMIFKHKIKAEGKSVPKSPMELQVKFKAEDEYTPEEKKELVTYLTGLDLNKDEYRLIYDLYDSKKYNFEYFVYGYVCNTDIYRIRVCNHDKLVTESGFAPTECIAALKYFNGSFEAAMRNFYASIYIEDEKEFQKEAYKMCLSKHHVDGRYPRFLISAEEYYNIKDYYMYKEKGLSLGEGVYGTDAYFLFPNYLFQYDKFYKTNGKTSSILLCADKIINLYSLFFSGHISERKYKEIDWIHYEVRFPSYVVISMHDVYNDLPYDLADFNENNSKDYLEISQEIFKLVKAVYLRAGIKRANNLPKDETVQDIVKIMQLTQSMDVQKF